MSVLLTQAQQQELLDITRRWIDAAENIHARTFPLPEVRFDLNGQAAGQYRGGAHPRIRYNPRMAASQFEAYCQRTPAHEVAHYIIDRLHSGRRVRPHGPQWRELMRAFGLEPERCHQYDLQNVPRRRQRRFAYRCACQEHRLSTTRHNRVQYRGMKYRCIKCGEVLRSASDD
ncbi:SprT family zinc-dependent metalloprotease [Thiolapillus sp.]